MHRSLWKKIISSPNQAAHVARCWLPQGEQIARHDHDFAETFLVSKGSGWHLLEHGEEALSPGMAVMVSRETVHGLRSEHDMEYINVAFPIHVFENLREKYNEAMKQKIYLFAQEQTEYLWGLAMSLGKEETSELRRDHFLLSVLQESAKKGSEEENYSRCPPWLRDACIQMKSQENFSHGIWMLSNICGRTPEHVARELKRCTGLSPSELITAHRMRYAARQLRFTRKTLIDISLECGYSSLSHFHKMFSNFWKHSPKAYRKLNRTL